MIFESIVSSVCRGVCDDFPGIDYMSVSQDLLATLGEPTPEALTSSQLRPFLVKRARKIAWLHRKDLLRSTHQYYYRPSDVSKLLEGYYHGGTWTPKDAKEGERDRNAHTEVQTDLKEGLRYLTPRERWVLRLSLGTLWGRVRQGEQTVARPTRSETQAALVRLTSIMNGEGL